MTDEMLALAQDTKRKSGRTNVHFFKGKIEHIPLPADSVDVIISNSVLNLAADKDRVLAEAFCVLKPGGAKSASASVTGDGAASVLRPEHLLWPLTWALTPPSTRPHP